MTSIRKMRKHTSVFLLFSKSNMPHFLVLCVFASVNKGELSISLSQVRNLAPFAQVVVYTVMPSGEAVADSQDFPIQLCLNNKVRLLEHGAKRNESKCF